MANNNNNNSRESWHLSKSVPISLIVVLLVQAGSFLWLISDMDNRIDNNFEDIAEIKVDVSMQETRQHNVDVKLGRIEEKLESLSNLIRTLSRKLDG